MFLLRSILDMTAALVFPLSIYQECYLTTKNMYVNPEDWEANPSTMTTNLPWKASFSFLPFAVFFHKDKRKKDGNDF